MAIDDHSRVSFADIHPNETVRSACQALRAALRYFKTFGVTFTRVMTDNGSCYRSKRFAQLCQRLKLRHIRTRPYTPRTNGIVERANDRSRTEFWNLYGGELTVQEAGPALAEYQHFYNYVRPHCALDLMTPMEYLCQNRPTEAGQSHM